MELRWEKAGTEERGYLVAADGCGPMVGRLERNLSGPSRWTAFVWNTDGEAIPVPAATRAAARAIIEAAGDRLAARVDEPSDGRQRLVGDVLAGRVKMLTTSDVARLFAVDSKTVGVWADKGLIAAIRTPGGHRRFVEAEVRALLEKGDDK